VTDIREKALHVLNITKHYPGVTALDSVSFDLTDREVHCLVGENGAGKSTLIKILSGAAKPDSGRLHIFGKEYDHLDPHTAMSHGIRTIYQEANLIESLSVSENIYFGIERTNRYGFFSKKQTDAEAADLLQSLGIDVDEKSPAEKLSVSEKQLIKIAKMLARKARILILDEPTTSLNKNETSSLLGMIKELKDKEIGIIYISHKLEEVFQIADRITVLRDGKKINTHLTANVNSDKIINEMVGKASDAFYRKEPCEKGAECLRVDGYRIKDDAATVSFNLHHGEILGIAGMVGSGRSELAKAVFGLETVERGRLEIDGKPVMINNPKEAIKNGISLVPEDRQVEGLVLCRNVRENISLASLMKNNQPAIALGAEKMKTLEMIESLDIKTSGSEQTANNLSGGNQQKVVLGKWLYADSDIFIFDEPTRGIDIGAKQEIYRLINTLAREGKAIIMISSEMPEILALSDRVMVMKEGAVAGILEEDEISEKNILTLALGISDENS
jgi:ribose transport system ATP-binding protein